MSVHLCFKPISYLKWCRGSYDLLNSLIKYQAFKMKELNNVLIKINGQQHAKCIIIIY